MSARTNLAVLIVEPNKKLVLPYGYLSGSYRLTRTDSIELALSKLSDVNPDLVFLSATFSISKSVKFLEALKNFSQFNLIPLIIVIDFSHPLNFVPGTSWGGKIAVLDSFVSQKELLSTMSRVLKS